METRFLQPVMDVFSFIWGKHSVLSADELTRIQSLELFVVDEQQRIRFIADRLSKAKHLVTRRPDNTYAVPALSDVAQVACFDDDRELTSFVLKERGAFCTRDGDWFEYNDTSLTLFDFAPQIRPFALRRACAHNIAMLGDRARFADPNRWCDNVQTLFLEVNSVYLAHAMGYFHCPGAGVGKCHYAMNPECRRSSPPGLVLLFETKAGWNQHGGPELFTFDHHEPRGGCVLRNDGTVKFIRTAEELSQLRWK